MDRLIRRFDSLKDGDLSICEARGIAYQRDMRVTARYDATYLAKVDAYAGGEIAAKVNAGRLALISRHLPKGEALLDYGAGSGEFLTKARDAGYDARGFEVIPDAASALKEAGLYADNPADFAATCLWDTIEHLPNPEGTLKRIPKGGHLFASIPVFTDLRAIRNSKHYRPGEHLYYWTATGFCEWLALYGFRVLESSRHEMEAGRESVGAFAFVRDLPDAADHVALYAQMHAERYYGGSATELHLEDAAKIVRTLTPTSIVDIGCGRSDLAAHFWRDGKRRIARLDPAIAQFQQVPEGRFDLAFCLDVLEHVPMAAVDQVLAQVKALADVCFFTISTKLARARLPDGRNAHVTLLSRGEWTRWLTDHFGHVQELPSKWEHELLIVAGHTKELRL